MQIQPGNIEVKSIADKVANGEIKFVPENWSTTYNQWLGNIQDWCISRQLWWGHRIPVWYRGEEMVVSLDPPAGEGWRQDEDVLDTWFSSWLWPFAILGWPEETEDLKRFYPNSLMVTGSDIIFFWVARMVMSGIDRSGMEMSGMEISGIVTSVSSSPPQAVRARAARARPARGVCPRFMGRDHTDARDPTEGHIALIGDAASFGAPSKTEATT